MRGLNVMAVALSLASCSTTPPQRPEPIIQTIEVSVPVPVPCPASLLPPPPAYPDSDEALRDAADIREAVQLLLAGRTLRRDRLETVEQALGICARPTPTP